MTADEAKQALKEGKKVAHLNWTRKEFIKLEIREIIVDESDDIYKQSIFDGLSDEWEIVE